MAFKIRDDVKIAKRCGHGVGVDPNLSAIYYFARGLQANGERRCRSLAGGKTGRTFCVVLTLKRRCLKSCRDDEVFSSYLPRPNTTLFVVTRPLVHNAMWILVPDRWIFIVKAGRASPMAGNGLPS